MSDDLKDDSIEEKIDEAAKRLAIESRALLGLPSENESNTKWIQKLSKPPSSLEFSRIVSKHIPILIENCIQERPCWTKWQSNEYLIEAMGNKKVKIALTPNGRADSICWNEEEQKEVFALPLEEKMTFKELFETLNSNKKDCIAYLQSQNSNLTTTKDDPESSGDLSILFNDILPIKNDVENDTGRYGSYSWADEALNCKPLATNLWIGNEQSVTSMHRDHYENLFTVIRGTKRFTLYPPCEAHFLCEEDKFYDVYEWIRDDLGKWKLKLTNSPSTPWIPIDPLLSSNQKPNSFYPLFSKALKPLEVYVNSGETLYLPAGWYHHVDQFGDSEEGEGGGVCVCVNWWYDSQIAFGDRWALEEFVKEIGKIGRNNRGGG